MGSYDVDKVTEQEISRLMVGRDVVLNIPKKECQPKETIVKIKDLVIKNNNGKNVVDHISFSLRAGEILGIAGVEGNGQAELIEALTGMGCYSDGSIEVNGKDIHGKNVKEIRSMKLSYIPEDRMTTGVAPHLSIMENMISDKLDSKQFFKNGFLRKKALLKYGREKVEEYQVFCNSPNTAIGSLSGGNIQKVVLARELSSDPQVIVADQPCRGVDVGAIEFIRKRLIQMRDAGSGVLLVSSDLNEILGLSDSLLVMFEGKIAAYIPDTSKLTEEELGSYMLGAKKQTQEEIKEAQHE